MIPQPTHPQPFNIKSWLVTSHLSCCYWWLVIYGRFITSYAHCCHVQALSCSVHRMQGDMDKYESSQLGWSIWRYTATSLRIGNDQHVLTPHEMPGLIRCQSFFVPPVTRKNQSLGSPRWPEPAIESPHHSNCCRKSCPLLRVSTKTHCNNDWFNTHLDSRMITRIQLV